MHYDVALVRYQEPLQSLRKSVDLVNGLAEVSSGSNVFIKPNLCIWRKGADFPKYGILTTARLIEDIVILLKENGATNITIGEGVAELSQKGVKRKI